jgi:hypothetical protein
MPGPPFLLLPEHLCTATSKAAMGIVLPIGSLFLSPDEKKAATSARKARAFDYFCLKITGEAKFKRKANTLLTN